MSLTRGSLSWRLSQRWTRTIRNTNAARKTSSEMTSSTSALFHQGEEPPSKDREASNWQFRWLQIVPISMIPGYQGMDIYLYIYRYIYEYIAKEKNYIPSILPFVVFTWASSKGECTCGDRCPNELRHFSSICIWGICI